MLRFLVLLAACARSAAAVNMSSWGRGINLGNTFDAPNEGDWAPVAKRAFFEDFAAAGFSTVRIPVRWDEHLGISAPYSIDGDFLDRVAEVVGWALAIPQFTGVILNSHHDDWLDTADADGFAAALPRFEALWTQVAARFGDDDAARLHFEVERDEGLTHTSESLASVSPRKVEGVFGTEDGVRSLARCLLALEALGGG